jgi:serine protease AprX
MSFAPMTSYGPAVLVVTLVLALVGPPIVQSAGLDPELEARMESMAADDEIRVIVKFRKRQGRRGARGGRRRGRQIRKTTGLSHKELRRSFEEDESRRSQMLRRHDIGVFSASRRVAPKFFAGLGRQEQEKSLWIVNGVAVQATKKSVLSLSSDPEVLEIISDEIVTLAEPMFSSQAVPEWNLSAVGATSLWDLGYRGSGVVVASMDTGVDVQHQDLTLRWRGGSNSWIDFTDPLQTVPRDPSGHGTQVMGILVAGDLFGNPIGMAPEATWIAAKIFNDQNQAWVSDIHLAFQWFLDPDGNPETDDAPDIVNASWGLLNSVGSCDLEFSDDLAALKSAGIAVVFAAGNAGPGQGTSLSPANGGTGLAVGAVNINLDIALGSSRGPSACSGGVFPSISAPGVAVWTTDKSFGGFPFYAQMTGTSFAAPHVAGGLALLRGAYPEATIDELEAAILGSAFDLGVSGPDNEHGQGLLDLQGAMNWLDAAPICSEEPNGLDSDQDGIPDVCDNCTLVSNAEQRDTDSDGFGNRCDTDFDNDGLVTMADVLSFIPAFGTRDPNFDVDGDGYVNFFDVVVLVRGYLKSPGPSGTVL